MVNFGHGSETWIVRLTLYIKVQNFFGANQASKRPFFIRNSTKSANPGRFDAFFQILSQKNVNHKISKC